MPAPDLISTPVPSSTSFFQASAPPPSFNNHPPSACIEEVTEAHIIQAISTSILGNESDSSNKNPFNFSQVFAAEKKKCESHQSKLLEFKATAPITFVMPSTAIVPSAAAAAVPPASAATATIPTMPIIPPPTPNASTACAAGTSATQNHAMPQYCYHSPAENEQQLMLKLESWLMQDKLAHTTPAHVLAASLAVRKDLVKKLQVQCVEASCLKEVRVANTSAQSALSASLCELAYLLPLHEINV